jgi:hypothetical protein
MEQNIYDENLNLKKQLANLEKELNFMKKILENKSSMVYNLEKATKNGEWIWIDTQMITILELKQLDQTDFIKKLIDNKQNTRYNDNDW